MNCGACGKTGLRSTTLAIVISDKGAPERKRVCTSCAGNGVFVVPMTRPILNNTEKAEQKSQQQMFAPFIKRCAMLAKAANASAATEVDGSPEYSFHAGRAEAYEAIVKMLKDGRI